MAEQFHGFKRTNYCGQLSKSDAGKKVALCGWVQKRRDLGSLIFIDLRDREGLVQLIFDENTDKELFIKSSQLRSEFVIAVEGTVRVKEQPNPKLKTGEIEVLAERLLILNEAVTTPFEITDHSNVNDALRLKYRYLDLRRPTLQQAIIMRHKVAKCARDYFDEQGFLEIETPILTKSTPEGARDYLVPSRVHQGEFYALPQSPQQYKQLLMLAGYDRYMQISRCFRDEDLRADRQPEFTQIDLEMSFVEPDDIMEVNEGFLKKVFHDILGVNVETPFMRLKYKDAMERFGSDKPDIRFGYELCNLSETVKNCGFKVFSETVKNGGRVGCINFEGLASKISRKEIDSLTEYVKTYGAKGLAYLKSAAGEASSSFAKFLTEDELSAVKTATNFKDGDILFIVADTSKVVFDSLGALRSEVARRLDLIDKTVYKFLWVTEFPLLEYDNEEGRFTAMHHPFTAPMDEDIPLMDTNPAAVRAKAYDIVLNGTELGGGSVRIYSEKMQQKMFSLLGFTEEEATERFGHLLEAFRYGTPPHGGLAYGLDRLVMLMAGKESLRDVIAFPKVQNASELMMGSPSPVDKKQLDELAISLVNLQ